MEQVIYTNRLILRPAEPKDIPQMIKGVGDLEVSKWLSVVPHPYGEKDAQTYLEYAAGPNAFEWAIIYDDLLIGCIGIDNHLGYWLAQPYWGRGFMPEAAQAVISNYFSYSDKSELLSGYYQGNAKSHAVLSRLGFLPTGQTKAELSKATNMNHILVEMQLDKTRWSASLPPPNIN